VEVVVSIVVRLEAGGSKRQDPQGILPLSDWEDLSAGSVIGVWSAAQGPAKEIRK
jgi:hypothetical protein